MRKVFFTLLTFFVGGVFAQEGFEPQCPKLLPSVKVNIEGPEKLYGISEVLLELFLRRKLEKACFSVADSSSADFTLYLEANLNASSVTEIPDKNSNLDTTLGGLALATISVLVPPLGIVVWAGALAEEHSRGIASQKGSPFKVEATVLFLAKKGGQNVAIGQGENVEVHRVSWSDLCSSRPPQDEKWELSSNECVRGLGRATLQALPSVIEVMRKATGLPGEAVAVQ